MVAQEPIKPWQDILKEAEGFAQNNEVLHRLDLDEHDDLNDG